MVRTRTRRLILIFAVLAVAGCGHAKSGPEELKLQAGRSVAVSGGKAELWFGGAPYGSAMVELRCGGNAEGNEELAEGESLDACGVHVVCLKIGRSNYGNDTGTFEVSPAKPTEATDT